MNKPSQQIVFLDRDGVINRRLIDDYVKSWDEFEFLPKVLEAVALLKEHGFAVYVVSNQSGVGRGVMSQESLLEIDAQMREQFQAAGARLDDCYYCLHAPEDHCDCRKPKSGLLSMAASEHGFEPKGAWMIGDMPRDIQAGLGVFARGLLLMPKREAEDCGQEQTLDDLFTAVQYILERK